MAGLLSDAADEVHDQQDDQDHDEDAEKRDVHGSPPWAGMGVIVAGCLHGSSAGALTAAPCRRCCTAPRTAGTGCRRRRTGGSRSRPGARPAEPCHWVSSISVMDTLLMLAASAAFAVARAMSNHAAVPGVRFTMSVNETGTRIAAAFGVVVGSPAAPNLVPVTAAPLDGAVPVPYRPP